MPRAGLTRDAVVDIALSEIDGGGTPSLGAVAARAGVRPPSLYKHVASLAELEYLVGARITSDLADSLQRSLAATPPGERAATFLRTYRAFAREHPDRYRRLPVRPIGHPELEAAGERLVTAASLIPTGETEDDRVHELRALRAAAHGFASLEAAGGFGLDVDLETSFERMVTRLAACNAAIPA